MKFIKTLLVIASLVTPGFLLSASAGQSKDQKQQPPKTDQNKKADEEQSLKLGTSLVTVPFNVTNKQNRYINDLTKNDIEILEDNKPQEVFSFERQTDLPITIAMLIDISLSQQYTLRDEIMAGQQFFRKVLRPNKDTAAVITFENEADLVQNLTASLEKLQRALESVRISVAAGRIGGPGTPPINDSGAGSTAMYDAIYAVSSDLLRREAGRRVIILVTDGDDTSSKIKMKDAIEQAWRSEIICYAIGIGDPYHYHIASGVLKKICEDTGGRAFFPRTREDQDVAYAKIDEDLRSQYVLAYQPTNETKDGSFRTIQLRVKNQKDLTVRHRRGYFASKES